MPHETTATPRNRAAVQRLEEFFKWKVLVSVCANAVFNALRR